MSDLDRLRSVVGRLLNSSETSARTAEIWRELGGTNEELEALTLMTSTSTPASSASSGAAVAKPTALSDDNLTLGRCLLLELPEDLLRLIIFDHLNNFRDILTTASTCRSLSRLVLGKLRWDCARPAPISDLALMIQRLADDPSLSSSSSESPSSLSGVEPFPDNSNTESDSHSSEDSGDDNDIESKRYRKKLRRKLQKKNTAQDAGGTYVTAAPADESFLQRIATMRGNSGQGALLLAGLGHTVTNLLAGLSLTSIPSSMAGSPSDLHWERRFFQDFPFLRGTIPAGDAELLWTEAAVDREARRYAQKTVPSTQVAPHDFGFLTSISSPPNWNVPEPDYIPHIDDVHVGDAIRAQWRRDGGGIYAGQISVVRRDQGGSVDIAYSDGDQEQQVPLRRVRLLRPPPPEQRRGNLPKPDEDAVPPPEMAVAPLNFRWPLPLWFPLKDLVSRDPRRRRKALKVAASRGYFERHLALELAFARETELEAARCGDSVWLARYKLVATGRIRFRCLLVRAPQQGGPSNLMDDVIVRKDRFVSSPQRLRDRVTNLMVANCPGCHNTLKFEEMNWNLLASSDGLHGKPSADRMVSDFQPGDTVRSRWSRGGGTTEYRAVVSAVNSDGSLEIDYTDGDHDYRHDPRHVRPDTPDEVQERSLEDFRGEFSTLQGQIAKARALALIQQRQGKLPDPNLWTVQVWPHGALSATRTRRQVSQLRADPSQLVPLEDVHFLNPGSRAGLFF